MSPLLGATLLLLLAGRAELPDAAPPATAAEQATAILSERAYQRELPSEVHPSEPPPWLRRVLKILAWAALGGAALGLVLGLVWLGRRLLRVHVHDTPLAAPRAPVATLEIPLDDARALAAAGRFDEAIHALLLATLAALARATRLAPSLTSREVLGRAALGPGAREALAGLVLAVEVSRFGGEVPSADDYRACLDRFHVFLDNYRSVA